MKKIISLVLAIVIVAVCFVSCGETPVPEETTIDLAEYRVIVPDNHSNAEEEYFNSFYSTLTKKIGKTVGYETDFLNEGLGIVETEREILIGNTNRKESVMDATEDGNYFEIKYVNKKIVIIAGNPYALEEALNKFLESIVNDGSSIIDVLAVKAIKEESTIAYYKELKGVTLTALGDSYFNYSKDKGTQNRWIDLLANKYGMKLNNKGIGGSTVSDVEGKNPMVNRLDSLPAKTDIILFEGGANDRGQGVPLGEDIDSRDKSTYTGAVNYVIDDLQKRYPNALLICITPWKVDNADPANGLLSITTYAKRMLEICEHRGVVCFDATNQKVTGVFMNDEGFRMNYCWSKTDIHHLNPEGMKRVFPAFEKFIGEEYAKFLSSK